MLQTRQRSSDLVIVIEIRRDDVVVEFQHSSGVAGVRRGFAAVVAIVKLPPVGRE